MAVTVLHVPCLPLRSAQREEAMLLTKREGKQPKEGEGTPWKIFKLSPESHGQKLAVTVIYVPCSLDGGTGKRC